MRKLEIQKKQVDPNKKKIVAIKASNAIIDSKNKIMPQLLVRNIEEKIVQKLKKRAGEHGVSVEEEHRRILREALSGKTGKRVSFKEYLLQMPDAGDDELFARQPDNGRSVHL